MQIENKTQTQMYKLPRIKVIKTLIVILFSGSEKKSEEKKVMSWREGTGVTLW